MIKLAVLTLIIYNRLMTNETMSDNMINSLWSFFKNVKEENLRNRLESRVTFLAWMPSADAGSRLHVMTTYVYLNY